MFTIPPVETHVSLNEEPATIKLFQLASDHLKERSGSSVSNSVNQVEKHHYYVISPKTASLFNACMCIHTHLHCTAQLSWSSSLFLAHQPQQLVSVEL